MGPIVVTQIAAGISIVAGAALVKSFIEQSNNTMAGPRCPSCGGSGRVTCFCSRWSDDDLGCRSCSGSGRMTCNSCGGSGTGRPLPLRVTANYRPPTN